MYLYWAKNYKKTMKNIAVILAGGTGNRMGNTLPKQFLEVNAKPVIAYTVEAFEQCAAIDEITVVIHAAYKHQWNDMAEKYHWKKVAKVLNGGENRADSTRVALQAYANLEEANILFHDAVRPLVNCRIITDVINALNSNNAVTAAIPTSDTILQTDLLQNTIAHIPSRTTLQRVQTPQGFKLSLIRKAYALAQVNPLLTTTDDCGVVHQYLPNEKIGIVKGEEFNFKITWPQDLLLMENLLQQQKEKVVLTYGTFDLFHYGHMEILRRAKALGTALMVGLSTDEFNTEKGKTCVQPYEKRKEILEGIRYVDGVFPETNWEQKIQDVQKYHAAVFVMGDDWSGKFDFLKPFCEVIYLPRTENISTTLIKKISGK